MATLSQNDVLLLVLQWAGARGLSALEIQEATRDYRDSDGRRCKMVMRCGARMWELNRKGHDIRCERDPDGVWRYKLATEKLTYTLKTPAPTPEPINVSMEYGRTMDLFPMGGAVMVEHRLREA